MIAAISRHPGIAELAEILEVQREDAVLRYQALGQEVLEALGARDLSDLFDEAPTTDIDVETTLTIAAITRERIRAIDGALSRISAGTFGLCRSCDRPIPGERLEALPYTEDCVDCAQHSHRR